MEWIHDLVSDGETAQLLHGEGHSTPAWIRESIYRWFDLHFLARAGVT